MEPVWSLETSAYVLEANKVQSRDAAGVDLSLIDRFPLFCKGSISVQLGCGHDKLMSCEYLPASLHNYDSNPVILTYMPSWLAVTSKVAWRVLPKMTL
jgi:hypothetical protein